MSFKIKNYNSFIQKEKKQTGFQRVKDFMPSDNFKMLICGPSNSGKTNILLNMILRLLYFDKIYLFAKNLHQDKYQFLLDEMGKVSDKVGYDVVVAETEALPLNELDTESQKIVVFDDMVCEKNQDIISNYFINCRHSNCSAIYLSQSFFKVPKIIRDNCSHFCILCFTPRENNRIADDIGVDRNLLERATKNNYSFLYFDKTKKVAKKNFTENI